MLGRIPRRRPNNLFFYTLALVPAGVSTKLVAVLAGDDTNVEVDKSGVEAKAADSDFAEALVNRATSKKLIGKVQHDLGILFGAASGLAIEGPGRYVLRARCQSRGQVVELTDTLFVLWRTIGRSNAPAYAVVFAQIRSSLDQLRIEVMRGRSVGAVGIEFRSQEMGGDGGIVALINLDLGHV